MFCVCKLTPERDYVSPILAKIKRPVSKKLDDSGTRVSEKPDQQNEVLSIALFSVV